MPLRVMYAGLDKEAKMLKTSWAKVYGTRFYKVITVTFDADLREVAQHVDFAVVDDFGNLVFVIIA